MNGRSKGTRERKEGLENEPETPGGGRWSRSGGLPGGGNRKATWRLEKQGGEHRDPEPVPSWSHSQSENRELGDTPVPAHFASCPLPWAAEQVKEHKLWGPQPGSIPSSVSGQPCAPRRSGHLSEHCCPLPGMQVTTDPSQSCEACWDHVYKCIQSVLKKRPFT